MRCLSHTIMVTRSFHKKPYACNKTTLVHNANVYWDLQVHPLAIFEMYVKSPIKRGSSMMWHFYAWFAASYSHLSNKRGVTLIDFENKIHPPRTFPPSTFIDFLDLFHPPLLVYCIYVLVFFSKKSHPPRLFQPPRLLERWEYIGYSLCTIEPVQVSSMNH